MLFQISNKLCLKLKVLQFLLAFFGWVLGRVILDVDTPSIQRQILQITDSDRYIGNCSHGSDQILTEYPSLVSIRNPVLEQAPNLDVLCGGVLLSTNTLLTSAGCIWARVDDLIPFNLVKENPVNRTIERDFKVAISPYCTHGDGAEVLQIYGYHYMEDDYNGFPQDGNAVAVLVLESNVTSLTNEELPDLREDPIPPNTVLTMVGHGAISNEEAIHFGLNYSRPPKIINFTTISDDECNQLLQKYLQTQKVLDGVTETCAVVEQIGERICNGDEGNPLFDSDGKIAGVVTDWAVKLCEIQRDQTMPIIFADVTKQKVQTFINHTKTESLYILPNITDGAVKF